ncbi:hypothetical protein G7074_04550 [Pedobacter sp. HDW13]|uniref:hypothetical protein n=1 Tax=unclassified Pedobacter TaxID=2628915 RepID=UPI000F593134|nr:MULTISPECIES: hypothetical protein [unclassified Pedobacter]QIL38613.1 hypothetical protein G7074_04550 [Pedobacter sp. HDW13]RQO78737.1 hypothetical protein DBR40_05610 [Pedobacter sp. KBW01]
MLTKEKQTQKFYWLKYEISAIQSLILNSPGIDQFVFCYFFPDTHKKDKPLQLIAYGYMADTNQYSSYFDKLEVYNNSALDLSGPIIMSNNIISLANIQLLINTADANGDKPDYLVFIPNVAQGHVFYNVKRFRRIDTGDVELLYNNGLDPIETNPSPPATIH